MKLEERLNSIVDDVIAILYFNSKNEIQCKLYEKCQFKTIPKFLIEAEVMEENKETDCLEIWVRSNNYASN